MAKTYRERLDNLANDFVGWPLPSTVCSDQCATIQSSPLRTGTTLLTAEEARQMLEYLLTDLPDVLERVDAALAFYASLAPFKATHACDTDVRLQIDCGDTARDALAALRKWKEET